ncbi:hypothetical protein CCR75_007121 [Bremia lactucae]|uniref:Secreted RxLR effector protein n=1 Tax=Bremia lactucae TaxID=4779 RepID=A0A976IBU1_BRELC|nr:hypothetical protein CCR75_007121 [Bremia lactucae]
MRVRDFLVVIFIACIAVCSSFSNAKNVAQVSKQGGGKRLLKGAGMSITSKTGVNSEERDLGGVYKSAASKLESISKSPSWSTFKLHFVGGIASTIAVLLVFAVVALTCNNGLFK